MFTIPQQPSEEHKPRFESLGPHFFSRTFKEEEGGSRSSAPNATLYDIYHIELSATALGMDAIAIFVLRTCADLGAAGFLETEKNGEDQQTTVGSATVSVTETRFKDSEDVYRSCKIEQLKVETGNILTNMEAFASMLRRIQSFCIEYHAEHLAMAPTKGSCWFSGLLKSAGFNLCDCECLDKQVDAGLQLCMVLPTPPIELPARTNEDSPMDDPAVDEAATVAKSECVREVSSIGDLSNRLMEKVQTEAKVLELQQVPAEDRVFSSSLDSANKPVKEPAEESAEAPAEEPAEEPSIKAGRRRKQESGPVTERSLFSKPSLPKRRKIGASPAAAEEVTSPEGSVADSPQPRVRSPFGVQTLIDSIKKEAPAPRKIINTPPAANIARTPVPLPKKEYCMYWIRRGECDYMQSGCKYKHEMPADEETRQRIGLCEIPGWFKDSPEYEQFLVQGDRSATGTLAGVGSGKKDLFRAPSSGRGSGRRGDDTISSIGGRVTMTGRPPGSHAVQSPRENHHQSILASDTEAKTPRDGPLSATKINSTNAVKRTADRRFDRGIYKPPGAKMSSGGDDLRAATGESSKVQSSSSEGSSRGQARSGGEIRIKGASSTHSGLVKEDVPDSMLAGRMKRRNSSPSSDSNDQRARPGRKGAKRGRNNGRVGN